MTIALSFRYVLCIVFFYFCCEWFRRYSNVYSAIGKLVLINTVEQYGMEMTVAELNCGIWNFEIK